MTIRLNLPAGESIQVVQPLTFGRLPECDVSIPDALVSGRHFEISPATGGATISDLNSSNGTFVNGERLYAPRLLTGGEEIAIGSHRITVERPVEAPIDDLSLFVRQGVDAGTSLPIADRDPIVIGRDEAASLRLGDPLVSARHCRITLTLIAGAPCPDCRAAMPAGDTHCPGCGRPRTIAEVCDLGSANGTAVDGAPVPTNGCAGLRPGSEITIGDTAILIGTPADLAPRGPAPTMIRPIPSFETTGIDSPHSPTPSSGEASSGGTAQPTGTPRSTPLPTPKRTPLRMPPLVMGILALGALALIALVVVVVTRGSGETPTATATPHDAAWVRQSQGSATVQVLAEKGGTDDAYSGSGSVIDAENGLVISNFHVFSDEYGNPLKSMSTFVRADGSEDWLDADIVGFSACEDLALLQINSSAERAGLGEVRLGTAESIIQGGTVVALGYPGTLESLDGALEQMSLTQGVISKPNVTTVKPYPNLIQIDADLNHGNSGGPLFNLDGIQVGINTLGAANDTQGIFYAISSVRVNEMLPSLKAGKKVPTFNSCPS